jgi:predicted transposase YdaD
MTTASPPGKPPPDEPITSVHDALFFHTYSQPEHAAAELKHILPQHLVAKIHWKSLRLASTKFVDPKLSSRHADLLFSVDIGTQKTYLHFLFEHESEYKPWSLLQALRYQVRIWDDVARKPIKRGNKRLPPIMTIILHHGENGWTSPVRFRDYFQLDDEIAPLLSPYLVDFGVLVDDIGKVDTDALVQRPVTLEGQLILFALRFGRTPPELLRELPKMAQVLRALLREPDGDRCIGTVFLYLQRVSKVPVTELRMALEQTLENTELIEDILFPGRRLAHKLQQSERELREAKREARKGERKGERTILLRQLGQRFGTLSPDVLARVDAAASSEIEAMALRVLTAKTLDEVLGKPVKHKRR